MSAVTICLQIFAMVISAIVSYVAFLLIAGLSGITAPILQGESIIYLIFGAIVLAICSLPFYATIAGIFKIRKAQPSVWTFTAAGAIQGAIFQPSMIVIAPFVTEKAFWIALRPETQVWMGLAISALLSAIVALVVITLLAPQSSVSTNA